MHVNESALRPPVLPSLRHTRPPRPPPPALIASGPSLSHERHTQTCSPTGRLRSSWRPEAPSACTQQGAAGCVPSEAPSSPAHPSLSSLAFRSSSPPACLQPFLRPPGDPAPGCCRNLSTPQRAVCPFEDCPSFEEADHRCQRQLWLLGLEHAGPVPPAFAHPGQPSAL